MSPGLESEKRGHFDFPAQIELDRLVRVENRDVPFGQFSLTLRSPVSILVSCNLLQSYRLVEGPGHTSELVASGATE